MQPIINFIGQVLSPLKSLDDCPRQANESAPEAMLEILPAYQQGITNIQAGDKLVLLTWPDRCSSVSVVAAKIECSITLIFKQVLVSS